MCVCKYRSSKQILIDMNTNKGGQSANAQSFQLPPEMNKVISATITDTIHGEILFCHDALYLFAAKLTKTSGNVVFQRFNLPNIQKILPIIKNYFIALFNNNKLVIFEVWFNEESKIMLKYVFNKNDKMYTSYFLREVVENMAEVHICYPENEIYIYQFTVNGKLGFMNYVIGPQNKIKADRQQLYGSKTIVCHDKKILYYFTNFSNKFVNVMNLNKLEAEICEQYKASLLAYVCIPKIEEHYMVMSNLVAVNVANNLIRHKISVDEVYMEDVIRMMQRKDCASFSVSTYFDMVMISDSELNQSTVFQIKQKASSMIAIEYGNFNWFWTATRKLVGLSANRNSFKMIQNLRLNPKNGHKQETIQFVIDQKVSEKIKQEKQKDYDNKSDDFLVKLHSHSELQIQIRGQETKSQIHSFGTLLQKKEEHQSALSQKIEPKRQAQETAQPKPKFVPNKIIQKKGVNISKSVNRSKENQPIPVAQQSINKDKVEEPKKVAQQQEKLIQIINKQPSQVSQAKEQINDKIELEKTSAIEIKSDQQQKEKQKNNDAKIEVFTNQNQDLQMDLNGQKQQQKGSAQNKHQKQQQQKQDQEQKQNNQESNANADSNAQQPAQQKNNDSNQQNNNYSEDSLSKNLALMIQKNNIAGFPPFSCSINRNKIFNSTSAPFQRNLFTDGLRKIQSETIPQQQYYNPFLSQSPLHTSQPPKQKFAESNEGLVQQPSSTESQIQKYNAQLIQKIKELFQTTTTRLLKSIEDVGNINTTEAYLKQKVREEIEKKVLQTLKNHVNGELTNRLELYFKEVFRQTSAVQEESIKFYKEAALHRTSHIEVQLNNQEKILKEIKDVQSMIRFSISELRVQTNQIYENLMSEWTIKFRQTRQIIDNITSVKHKLEEESVLKAKRFEEIKNNLQTIKNRLIEKNTLQQERKQKKLQEKAAKLKQLAEKKNKKKKKTESKVSGEKEKKSKLKRGTEI